MSLRPLVVGDPHFQVKHLKNVDEFISKVQTAARRLKPDFIVVSGDLLDGHERIHVDALTRAIKFLELLSEQMLTFLTVGNHDRRNNSDFLSEIHPFTGLNHRPNLIIVDHPIKYEVVAANGARGNFLFVPYVAPGRFTEALDLIDLSELEDGWRSSCIDAIFCHQEFAGVQLGGIKSVNGDVWQKDWPLIISGHIHEYQELQSNIIYPGTPMQNTFSESPDKAVILFDINPEADPMSAVMLQEVKALNELKPDQRVKARYARIDLGLCKRVQIKLPVDQVSKFQPRPNQLTKLIVQGTPSELKALNKTNVLSRLRKQGIVFAFLPVEEAIVNVSHTVEQKGYLQTFRELIADDAELRRCFDLLYPA